MSQPAAGQRVSVVQHVRWRDRTWSTEVVGTVISCQPQPTGSWFVHAPDGRLWLQRLRLQKDDGELVDLILDQRSQITRLDKSD
ncbi:MAG: hypothetical protein ACE5K7_05780 [Phycisphaerae bacterium]